MDELRIVFMGTPEFAVHALEALLGDSKNVVAVITAPDKPAGRGLTMHESDVKKYAKEKGIPILQPEKLKDPLFIQELENLQPDLAVVVAFRMLPEIIWSMPRLGTINLHASLLPQYRGAAPINWAIINGEHKTGITTFFIEKEIDTGKIIDRQEIAILPTDTAGTLHDKLAAEGAKLLLKTVNSIQKKDVIPITQDSVISGQVLKPAPKIFRDDCHIDWNQDIENIFNFIRGLSPYPGAWTSFCKGQESRTLKVLECTREYKTETIPGSLEFNPNNTLSICGQGGKIIVSRLQLEGKKPMNVEEFVRGLRDVNQYFIQ